MSSCTSMNGHRGWRDVRSLWTIVYEVVPAHSAEYLAWFHGVHIPEKLGRPGYFAAAHYRIVGPGTVSGQAYVALFGAPDTRVFLDPSPGQLKTRQDQLTRAMVGHRRGTLHLVMAEEWRAVGPEQETPGAGAPVISLRLFDTGNNDDAVGAWYAQELHPLFAKSGGCIVARKLLSSIGGPRHGLLAGYASRAAADTFAAALPRRPPAHATAPGFPVVAERIWPAPG